MNLYDTMEDAVADVAADLPSLAAVSRRHGLAIRRRRRALATIGTVAAASVLLATAWAVLPGDGAPDGTVATETATQAVITQLSGATEPITDRGAAAALASAIGEVADGTFNRFQGDVFDDEAMAALLFLPVTGGGPAGQVMINLQPLNGSVGKPPYTCDQGYMTAMTDCKVRTLTNGDTLRTYLDDGDTEFGADSQRTVAEVLSPERRLRVVVFALNTNPWADASYRDRTVLDTDQLTEIATQPWWSRAELPAEYINAGKQLENFS
jgi:hypothetical protein